MVISIIGQDEFNYKTMIFSFRCRHERIVEKELIIKI